ncbi:hypothetical protein AAFC00_005774 [Neodothiora populina]|uniref:VASt domain-containing protein n=1 Tax=Neodothiora populina TaxID=2781224 RepID=A0ABR3P5S9_9PEZI
MSTLEAPTEPPRRGLSKLRRSNRKDSSKNGSCTSLAPAAADEGSGGIRASIDGAIEKLKDRRRKSSDDRRTSSDSNSTSRMSRLPLQLPRKSRRKRSGKDDGSPLGIDNRDNDRGISPSPSDMSIGLEGSGHSSLLTEESDYEEKPSRPTLSPHDSHAGYLTLSSPLINARAAPAVDDDPSLDQTVQSVSQALNTHSSVQAPSSLDSSAPISDSGLSRDKSGQSQSTSTTTQDPQSHANSEGLGLDLNHPPDDKVKDTGNSKTLQQGRPRRKSVEKPVIKVPSTPEQIHPSTPLIVTAPATPPNTVGTPITYVTPPTPTLDQRPLSPPIVQISNATAANPALASSNPPTSNTAVNWRRRTGTLTLSKLSTSILSSPLTPHIEEVKTPGGTLTTSSGATTGGAGSFFSSVFSAAQNAANQFTNTINTSINQNQKSKSSAPERVEETGGEEVIPGPEDQTQNQTESGPKRQLAVETLGKGDLNLSHLGISDGIEVSPMSSQLNLPQAAAQSSENVSSAEENAAAQAVSVAYEKPVKDAVSQATGRPQSVGSADGSEVGMQTPPRSSMALDGVKRSGSVRSRLSSDRRRRTRGSSAATSNTLAPPAGQAPNGPGHRLTGFAVASSKRNKDFHQLFRSVPEDDYLIEDYSAALQRDILLHGRLYVSEGHICFSSNILGWVTNLVISFDEVVSIEKKSTAVIFPNAIVIQTLHARNIFASLVARDSTYDLLIGIWKISHPNLKSSLNGIALDDASTGDKTEKAGSIASEDASDEGSEDEVYDEDEDDGDEGSFYEPTTAGSIAGSDAGDGLISRKTSAAPIPSIPGQPASATLDHSPTIIPSNPLGGGGDIPGPVTHAATECTDEASHYPNKLIDTTIPAPLGKVYSLMWGPQSSTFMRTFLVDNQKSRELDFAPQPLGLDNANKELVYSFIKPLNAPVGPKQTKCIVTAKLDDFDLEKAVTVGCSTATPDVPSGGVFETKTRYCLMWGPGNSTRFIASCTVEWSGKSWLKGPIEKGANDGQIQYTKDLVASLRAATAAKAPAAGRPGKKGRSRRREKESSDQASAIETESSAKAEMQSGWGPLEPIRPFVEPIGQILGPMLSAQLIIGIMALLLAYSWLWPSSGGKHNSLSFPITTPDRLAAYEEIWRREESELWDWLEDRVGLNNGIPVARYGESTIKADRQKLIARKAMGKKLDQATMEQNQIDDAIRITEERLSALKDAMKHRKGQ